MEDKMLVMQALCKRDLLAKKINAKIQRICFVDGIKHNESKVIQQELTKEVFCKEAMQGYQEILDMIHQYHKLDEAILASNARTFIETSYGKFSVALAILMRNRLRKITEQDFETKLRMKMEDDFYETLELKDLRNRRLEEKAEKMRLSILERDNKDNEDRSMRYVEKFVFENSVEMVDPLDILHVIDNLKDKHNLLLSELETKIKISNATTYIS